MCNPGPEKPAELCIVNHHSMKRRNFLQSLVWLPLTTKAMNIISQQPDKTGEGTGATMPVLFIGHGSPMNAIEANHFTEGWRSIGKTIPEPGVVVCISAHWETRGTFVTAMEKPRTIHDFYGFPENLYQVQYPAPGSPATAADIVRAGEQDNIRPDLEWGLDHGAWSILTHLFPDASFPVIQVSLNHTLSPAEHYRLAGVLAPLRRKGALILGSGNLVHNLRLMSGKQSGEGFHWAEEAQSVIKNKIDQFDHRSLFNYPSLGTSLRLAVPTPEHFLPALYALALREKDERITWFNDQRVMGSISMASFKIS